ncbi:MAG TPA: type II toxin-antitoxin system RelE/ParE family toxin [Streptosporangiaceae bacterium]|nr:type II toxin-antitoxin system RelE/ParE family toxin [Streptosporangiaceae bacterium]
MDWSVTRLDLPSMIYIIEGMNEIALEPEVEAWLLSLPYGHYQRVMRNVDDYLVTGGIPDGDHVKKLQAAEGVYELRVALDRTTWRITFWKPGGQLIILLTFFRKTRDGTQRADVDRAVRAMNTCRTEHDRTITHDFERSE